MKKIVMKMCLAALGLAVGIGFASAGGYTSFEIGTATGTAVVLVTGTANTALVDIEIDSAKSNGTTSICCFNAAATTGILAGICDGNSNIATAKIAMASLDSTTIGGLVTAQQFVHPRVARNASSGIACTSTDAKVSGRVITSP